MRSVLAIVCLFLAIQPAWCNAVEREAFAVVLAEFTARTDLLSRHNAGITLIRPATHSWSFDRLRSLSLLNRPGACGISVAMYEALAKANTGPADLTRLVPNSSRWRVLKSADIPSDALNPDKTSNGEPIKTIAHLSNAGVSPAGDSALVLVSFLWSMHMGVAQYVLHREPAGWNVKCSELVFYP